MNSLEARSDPFRGLPWTHGHWKGHAAWHARPPNDAHPARWGAVEKLPSGRFRAEGIKYPAPHTFTTREAAQGWLATERAERALGTGRDPRLGQIILTEYASNWLDSRTDMAPRTRQLYSHLLDRRVLPAVNAEAGDRLALASSGTPGARPVSGALGSSRSVRPAVLCSQ